MAAKAALLFRKPLFLFAFWTAAVHFAIFQIIFKKQPAARALNGPRFVDNRFAAGDRAFDYGFAVAAPVLAFEGFAAAGTFFGHGLTPSVFMVVVF